MQTLYGGRPVSRLTTGRAVRIIERTLVANGVTRARDLPEEARVRLYRRLTLFFEEERAAEWERHMDGRLLRRIQYRLLEALETVRQAMQA